MLGEVAEELGMFDEARRHFEDNLAQFSRMGDLATQERYRKRLELLDDKAGMAAPALPQELQREDRFPSDHVPTPLPLQPPALNQALVEPLSAREIEVLGLLAEGLTNREIALRLYLSPNTVRVHTFHIYAKLAVNNRTQAVNRARTLGLLASD
jgi:ATP/maltotriose-dependent transcriptional regulator MalT